MRFQYGSISLVFDVEIRRAPRDCAVTITFLLVDILESIAHHQSQQIQTLSEKIEFQKKIIQLSRYTLVDFINNEQITTPNKAISVFHLKQSLAGHSIIFQVIVPAN